jgi:hypothetical protein
LCRLQLFQPQLQLVDLARELLRGTTKLQPAQLGDHQLQVLDLDVFDASAARCSSTRRCSASTSFGSGGNGLGTYAV